MIVAQLLGTIDTTQIACFNKLYQMCWQEASMNKQKISQPNQPKLEMKKRQEAEIVLYITKYYDLRLRLACY